jgi:hypothetical protein
VTSLTNGSVLEPTQEEYALVTQITSSTAVGGTEAPTQPNPANVWEEVVIGKIPKSGSFIEPSCPSSKIVLPAFSASWTKETVSPT